ncbi:OmpW/AlkL family protein [Microbulbifer magnicolonia]|uniref:OmpW/AlkL family protein n=1 Tax=Microbulbifer magnicolonia TaxID=3109744 RepID=UPI002B4177C8|nr:OmpW family outer membrane protein [Microbulbifer sp. GG15]
MFRVGASFVDPDDDGNLDFRGYREFFPDDDFLVDDDFRFGFDVDDEWTWNFTAGFMPIDHFMVEVGYIGESDHDVKLKGVPVFNDDLQVIDRRNVSVGDLERWSGFVNFNWFPVCPESWVQPYVGVGINYSEYDDQNVRVGIDDFLVDFAGGVEPANGRIFYEDDWGWNAQVGIDIMFGRNSSWLVNGAIMYMDAEVEGDLHYNIGAPFVNAVRSSFDFDPWVYNIGIGYKF